MAALLRRFSHDTSGATAIEYGLIAGMVACVLIGALQNMSGKMTAKFNKIANALS